MLSMGNVFLTKKNEDSLTKCDWYSEIILCQYFIDKLNDTILKGSQE